MKDEEKSYFTVNGSRFCMAVTTFFISRIEDLKLVEMWLQDDVTCYTTFNTMNLLAVVFHKQFIFGSSLIAA